MCKIENVAYLPTELEGENVEFNIDFLLVVISPHKTVGLDCRENRFSVFDSNVKAVPCLDSP